MKKYSLNLRLQIDFEDKENTNLPSYIINLFQTILNSSFFKKNKIKLVWHDGGELMIR
jgi:hypothetical protein